MYSCAFTVSGMLEAQSTSAASNAPGAARQSQAQGGGKRQVIITDDSLNQPPSGGGGGCCGRTQFLCVCHFEWLALNVLSIIIISHDNNYYFDITTSINTCVYYLILVLEFLV